MDILYKLRCLGYVETGDDLWFSNIHFNALIKLNKLSGRIQIIDRFPGYEVRQKWLFSNTCMVKDLLIFVPYKSKEIVTYNIRTEEFSIIPLDLKKTGGRENYFGTSYVNGKYIYMFPAYAKCIIRFDIEQKTIKYFINDLKTILNRLPEESLCFAVQYEVVQKKLYIPFAELNAMAVFNLENESLDIVYLGINGGCSTVNYAEGNFYLAAWKKRIIYQWNEKSGKMKTYDLFPKGFEKKNYMFSFACVMEKQIFFFPLESNMMVSLDIKTGKIIMERKIADSDNEEWKVYAVNKMEGRIQTIMAGEENICQMECQKGKSEWTPYFQQDFLYNNRRINQFILKQIYQVLEKKGTDLNKYIEMIVDSDDLKKNERNSNNGKVIFNHICAG